MMNHAMARLRPRALNTGPLTGHALMRQLSVCTAMGSDFRGSIAAKRRPTLPSCRITSNRHVRSVEDTLESDLSKAGRNERSLLGRSLDRHGCRHVKVEIPCTRLACRDGVREDGQRFLRARVETRSR